MQSVESLESLESLEVAVERLQGMAGSLEETLAGLERRLAEFGQGGGPGCGQVEAMVATVESVSAAQVEALEARLAEAERQLAVLHAAAVPPSPPSAGRRTLGVSAASLLAKHGVGETGPVEASAVDAALASLPVEQRIAVKSQLLRAGLLS